MDRLLEGRLELGLGAGYAAADFEIAGLPWEPAPQRVSRLSQTISLIEELIDDRRVVSQPGVQQPRPPILVGGQSDRVLTVAAAQADIVGFTGGKQPSRGRLGRLIPADFTMMAERVALLRDQAGDRFAGIELNVSAQWVAVTNAAIEEATTVAARLGGFSPAEILQLPTYFIGTPREIADRVRRLRDELGFTYISIAEPWMEIFTPVIALLR